MTGKRIVVPSKPALITDPARALKIYDDLAQVEPGSIQCLAADPPWKYKTWSDKGLTKSAEQHYSTLPLEEIVRLPIKDIAAKDCWLFLWTTWTHMEQALAVMRAWGFKYSSNAFVWWKLRRALGSQTMMFVDPLNDSHFGMGHTTRKATEPCILGRRGKPKRLNASVLDILISPVREHSRKPDDFFPRVEKFCAGPRLELFARETRPGWVQLGDQVTKFDINKAA